MKTHQILFLLTLTSFGIWLTEKTGWLGLTLYLFILTILAVFVGVAANSLEDGKNDK